MRGSRRVTNRIPRDVESRLEWHRIRLEEQRSVQWAEQPIQVVGFFVVAPHGGFDHGLDLLACEVSSDGDNTDAVHDERSRVSCVGSGVDRKTFRQCLDLSACEVEIVDSVLDGDDPRMIGESDECLDLDEAQARLGMLYIIIGSSVASAIAVKWRNRPSWGGFE